MLDNLFSTRNFQRSLEVSFIIFSNHIVFHVLKAFGRMSGSLGRPENYLCIASLVFAGPSWRQVHRLSAPIQDSFRDKFAMALAQFTRTFRNHFLTCVPCNCDIVSKEIFLVAPMKHAYAHFHIWHSGGLARAARWIEI
jgi:hypothetical protein